MHNNVCLLNSFNYKLSHDLQIRSKVLKCCKHDDCMLSLTVIFSGDVFDLTLCFYLPDSKPDRVTPTPIDPEEIEVNIAFQPDPTDLVLSSVPGGELFNPRKHRFSEDELKPQPMIKKAKKVYVPEDAKVRLNLII